MKWKRTKSTFQGMTLEELIRETGLDKLSYDECFRGLFSEYYEDDDEPEAGDEPEDDGPTPRPDKPAGATVTQLGPGRRDQPKDE